MKNFDIQKFLVLPLFLCAISMFVACTDYEEMIDDEHDDWVQQSINLSSVNGAPSLSSSSVKNEISSSTGENFPGMLRDARDGQVYRTVIMGYQTWMAENLNYEVPNSYCYKDNANFCAKYGRLYTWEAATTACPDGWHLPNNSEWQMLLEHAGGIISARSLKSVNGWIDDVGADSFGFTVLPAGYRHFYTNEYYNEGRNTAFWSASEINAGKAYGLDFVTLRESVQRYEDDKSYGLSVRCIQDWENGSNVWSSSSSLQQSSSSISASSSSVKSSSSSFRQPEFITWCGGDGSYQIETGYDAGNHDSGLWFVKNDEEDGGASSITWPVAVGNEYDLEALDPVIDYCGGVCGFFQLDKGSLVYNPFVDVGFHIAGTDPVSDSLVAADVTEMGGICITYRSDVAVSLLMSLGDSLDTYVGFDIPAVTLPRSYTGMTRDITWTQFKQAGWGSEKITGEAAAANLVSLIFRIQGANGTTGQFNIMTIGPMGRCAIGS